MLFLYAGGVFTVLVNIYFITRKFYYARLISTIVVLLVAICCLPFYMDAVTEIDSDSYNEINKISTQVQNDKSAQSIKTLIAESLENNKISTGEYKAIKNAYEAHKQQTLKQSIAKGGA